MKLSYFLVSTLTFYFLLMTYWGYQNMGSILFDQQSQLTVGIYFKKGIEKNKIVDLLTSKSISEKQVRYFSEEEQLQSFSKDMNLEKTIDLTEVLQSLTPYVEIVFRNEKEKNQFNSQKIELQEYIENSVQQNTWTEKFALFALYFEGIAKVFFFFVFVISMFIHLTLFRQMIQDKRKEFFLRRLCGQATTKLFSILARQGLIMFLASLAAGYLLSFATYSLFKFKANLQIQYLMNRLSYIQLFDVCILTTLFASSYLLMIYLGFKKSDALNEEQN